MRPIAILLAALFAGGQDSGSAPDFTLKDADGKTHALSALRGRKAVVLVFTGID